MLANIYRRNAVRIGCEWLMTGVVFLENAEGEGKALIKLPMLHTLQEKVDEGIGLTPYQYIDHEAAGQQQPCLKATVRWRKCIRPMVPNAVMLSEILIIEGVS